MRAMQIIDELEPIKRGGYGGAIGYLSYGGDLDTAIHIRTVVVKDGRPTSRPAAARSPMPSLPTSTRSPSRRSSAAMRAIALACEQPDWP